MDRGAWWATVHRVTKSRTQLRNWAWLILKPTSFLILPEIRQCMSFVNEMLPLLTDDMNISTGCLNRDRRQIQAPSPPTWVYSHFSLKYSFSLIPLTLHYCFSSYRTHVFLLSFVGFSFFTFPLQFGLVKLGLKLTSFHSHFMSFLSLLFLRPSPPGSSECFIWTQPLATNSPGRQSPPLSWAVLYHSAGSTASRDAPRGGHRGDCRGAAGEGRSEGWHAHRWKRGSHHRLLHGFS